MAHSLSAKKRIRQNARCRSRNRARKTQMKFSIRSFNETLASGADAEKALRSAIRKIDQIASKGAIHKNTASRRKSQLQRRLNALQAQS